MYTNMVKAIEVDRECLQSKCLAICAECFGTAAVPKGSGQDCQDRLAAIAADCRMHPTSAVDRGYLAVKGGNSGEVVVRSPNFEDFRRTLVPSWSELVWPACWTQEKVLQGWIPPTQHHEMSWGHICPKWFCTILCCPGCTWRWVSWQKLVGNSLNLSTRSTASKIITYTKGNRWRRGINKKYVLTRPNVM